MADKKDNAQEGARQDTRVSEFAPMNVTRWEGDKPSPSTSNADVDLSAVSFNSEYSTVHDAPDQNPLNLRPAPGPQRVEVLGVPKES